MLKSNRILRTFDVPMSAKLRKLRLFFKRAMQKHRIYRMFPGKEWPLRTHLGSPKHKHIITYDDFLMVFLKNIVFYEVFFEDNEHIRRPRQGSTGVWDMLLVV